MNFDFSGTWTTEVGHRLTITSLRGGRYRVRYEPSEKRDRRRLRFDLLMWLRLSGEFPGRESDGRLMVEVYSSWGPDICFSPIRDDSNGHCMLVASVEPGPFLEYEEINGLKWFDTKSAFGRCDDSQFHSG